MKNTRRILAFASTLTFCIFFAFALFGLSTDKKQENIWVTMEERIKIWDAIAGGRNYAISANGLEATFNKDGTTWTIIGANAPIVNPTVYPKEWPVKGNNFEVLVIPEPITNYRILPFTDNIENSISSNLISLTAASGSYEPVSFVIRSGDVELKDVMVEVTDLRTEAKGKNGNAFIQKENIDVRVVKCWYQAGIEIDDLRHKILTPELLLHDDDLVRVDYERQVNLLRDLEKIKDTERLRPFTIPQNQNKQIWIIVRVPDDAKTGIYSGQIRILGSEKILYSIPLRISVLPFKLPKPYYTSSIYYRGKLDPNGTGSVSSEFKSEVQFKKELENMYGHGVTNPIVYQSFNKELLAKVLEIRNKVGIENQPIYYYGVRTGAPATLERIENLMKRVEEALNFFKTYGVTDVYFYGIDEARGEELRSERLAWTAVHKKGGRVFVSGYESENRSHFEIVGDILDLLICSGRPSKDIANKWHSAGHKIWSYANPPAGAEAPEIYRRNYGLLLWENNYDGGCPYAYQHGFGNIWNDFDSPKHRDLNFTYPTITGIIDTIAWEGYRKGVDDVRYLTALYNTCQTLKDSNREAALEFCKRAELYLKTINSKHADLALIRSNMIDLIIEGMSY